MTSFDPESSSGSRGDSGGGVQRDAQPRHPVGAVLESLVADLTPRLPVSGADVVRRGRRRARVRGAVSVGGAALLVAGVAVAGSWVWPGGRGGTRMPADATRNPSRQDRPTHAAADAPDPGWRWIAANGLEVQVPAGWAVNPVCPDGDYVLRADWLPHRPKCGPGRDPASMTAVQVDALVDASGLAQAPDGGAWSQVERATWEPAGGGAVVEVVRARSRMDDGRTVWVLGLPRLGRAVTVTTRDGALAERVLAGVRVVDGVDAAGCPVRSPGMPAVLAAGRPAAVGVSVPDDVVSVSACVYGAEGPVAGGGVAAGGERTASASGLVTGAQARAVVDALRAAPVGLNPPPDLSAVSCVAGSDGAGVEVRLHRAGGATVPVWVSYQRCSGVVGASDGSGTSRVTKDLLAAVSVPLGVYIDVSAFDGDGEG